MGPLGLTLGVDLPRCPVHMGRQEMKSGVLAKNSGNLNSDWDGRAGLHRAADAALGLCEITPPTPTHTHMHTQPVTKFRPGGSESAQDTGS